MKLPYLAKAAPILFVFLSACGPEGPIEPLPPNPLGDISDGAHNGGNPHFFWLPRMVRTYPVVTAAFDAARNPTVTIRGGAIDTTFTMTTGIKVSTAAAMYHVGWSPRAEDLVEGETIRITAAEGGVVLGYLDILVVDKSQKQLVNTTDDEYLEIPEDANGVIQIRFRIEVGALPDLTTGLIAWYPFDGNALDASGNGHHPAYVGASPTSDRFGNPNSAYEFDGTPSSRIRVPDSPSLQPASITLAAWVLIDAITAESSPAFFDRTNAYVADGYRLGINYSPYHAWTGDVFLASSNYLGARFTDEPIELGQWVFLAITYDGLALRRYKNGVLVSTTNGPGGPISYVGTTDLGIGGRMTGTDHTIDGRLDDLRIYNRPLTAFEVHGLFTASPP